MAIAHTFAHKTKAFPEANRHYLDPLPEPPRTPRLNPRTDFANLRPPTIHRQCG